ncbi:MAG: discoidin domain-containing protein, partial [Bacteroidota bacterium]|nr:discoidin domain-containing protein [Bacteroidota bacterium]
MRTHSSFNKKLFSPFLNVLCLLVVVFTTRQSFAQVNLALNKSATASSVQALTSYTADNAFDGNTNTRWASSYGSSAWIYVDLGAIYNITQINLLWEEASGRDYRLQVASANPGSESSWTTMHTVTGNTVSGTYLNYVGLTGNGRYVRMIGTARNLSYGYSLFEFQVFGTPNQAPNISSNGGLATANISIPENTTNITTLTATDESPSTLVYSIAGGADAGKFTINPTTKVLSFNSAPNFEAPGSAATSNAYTVIVRVTDNGGLTDDQTVTVTVTNVNEAPVASNITTSPQVGNTALQKAIANLVATDPDGGADAIGSFRITSLPTSGTLYINNVAVTSNNLTDFYPATNNQLTGLSYTPASGFTGNATFTFTATDRNTPTALTSSTATYTIPVTADNPATYTYTAPGGFSKFGLQNGIPLATATDPNGTITGATVTGNPLPAFLTLNQNGNITVNRNAVEAGTYSTNVTLTDIRGGRTVDIPITLIITNDNYQANANAIKTGENCYQLTADATNQRGQVWRATPISLSNDFEISFNAYFGNHDGVDGIAFGFQRTTNPLFAVGNPGEGIGFGHGAPVNNVRSGGISPSVAIEFDTHNNGLASEIAADHIAIFKNGDERNPVTGTQGKAVQMSSNSANVEDNATHLIQIIWKSSSKTLYVYFDGTLRQQYSEDFINTVFGGDPSVYFGYTASTGSLTNLQSVCDITLDPMDSDGDGIADVTDLDDDNDGIPD